MSDERPLGRPIQRPRADGEAPPKRPAPAPEPAAAPRADPFEGNTRAGDSGVGRPVQRPAADLPLGPSVEEFDRREDLVGPTTQPARARLHGPMLGFLVAGAFALLGLFVFAQVVSILADLSRLPAPLSWVGYGFAALALAVIGWAAFKGARLYLRLRPARQVDVAQVALRGRPAEQEAARAALRGVLRAWAKDGERVYAQLEQLALDPAARARLERATERLLERRPISAAAWLDEFDRGVARELDALADARTRAAMKTVALKTAVSPNALLDTAIVLYQSFRLIGDLTVIYRVRADRVGTVYLLGWVLFHGFIAGEMEELGEEVVTGTSESAFESLVGGTTAHLLGKVVGRVAVATTNAFFMRRLGRRARRLLRPILQ